MKAALLSLAALSTILLAGESLAKPASKFQPWLNSAAAAVGEATPPTEARYRSAVVSADVDANRRLSSPRLLRSTGSVEADRAVLKAVRSLKLPEVPPQELINRRVVLSIQAPVADTVVAGAAPVSP